MTIQNQQKDITNHLEQIEAWKKKLHDIKNASSVKFLLNLVNI